MRFGRILLFLTFLCLMVVACVAAPPAEVDLRASVALENADGAYDSYRAIGRLNGDVTCTTVFVAPGDNPAAPATVLTSGRCAGAFGANETFTDREVDGWIVQFNNFADMPDAQVELPVQRIVYATMRGMDVAVLELDATVQEMADAGITPLALTTTEAEPGTRVIAVSSASDEDSAEATFLRAATCTLDDQADLLEFVWQWHAAWRNDCADITSASAGSPLLDVEDNRIVALSSTTTAGSDQGNCYLDRPCEIGNDGVTVREAANYAVSVAGLNACFSADGVLDVTLDACPLPGAELIGVSGAPMATQAVTTDSDGNESPVTWNATVSSGAFSHYRTKIGPVTSTDCRDGADYSEPLSLADGGLIDDPLPLEDGFYVLCVIGGNSEVVDETWQDSADAISIRVEIDATPPTIEPLIAIRELDDVWRIGYRYTPPEISAYLFKIGPLAATDCTELLDYFDPGQGEIDLAQADGPYTLCVIAIDQAGNAASPLVLTIE
ncbi:MAG: hypothetical protein M9918_05830 [Anaerolineae bacterium]|nr:hypothetical protein [Anaerolineae bacterium]